MKPLRKVSLGHRLHQFSQDHSSQVGRVFNILFFNVDFMNYRDHSVARVDAIIKIWDTLVKYFISTPIRLCNGERYRKKEGIASGCYFTQLVESIANYILLQYALLKAGVTPNDILVFGDDSIVSFEHSIYPSDLAPFLSEVGVEINTKSHASRNISKVAYVLTGGCGPHLS